MLLPPMHHTSLLLLLVLPQLALAQISCQVDQGSQCFPDFTDGKTRYLLGDVQATSQSMSKQMCAELCFQAGLPFSGVEFASECHCGTAVRAPAPPSSKCTTPCSGNKSETCGGTDAIEIFTAKCTGSPLPNYKGCVSEVAKTLPYCNSSLSVDERVDDLVSRLSLPELIGSISPQPNLGDTCGDHTAGKPEIGLPDYFWLTETNTNVAAKCHPSPYRCPTTFIGPMGMGASFNRTSWRLKGGVIGTEMRAFNNLAWHRGNVQNKIGLTGFGPNLNIARDPRFGRISELPSEDPYHSGHYGGEMVLGMQEKDARGHPKMLAYLKHYTAYSTESNRGHDSYAISMFDYWDSYLAQYEITFRKSSPSGVMCSYDAENGNPSCANSYILNDVMRGKFGQEHALVTTDCGAVSNMRGPPTNTPTDALAAAYTINNGTDIEMGSTVWTDHLLEAVHQGHVTEDRVKQSARRAFRQLLIAGRFDPPENIGWSSLGLSDINSTHSQQVQKEAAEMGMVLLKNENSLLPLKPGSKLAVVGPMGISTDLMSDYAGGTGEAGCWPSSDESCIVTIGQAIANANQGGQTWIHKGVDVNSQDKSGINAALDAVKAADVAVLVIGNDRTQEHEGIDRPDTALPGLQSSFAQQVISLNKPLLLIMSNGGALAIDNLVAPSSAIVECFNPAQNTPQLASLLFGKTNRWGKLPVTLYPHSYTSEQSMVNYNMAKAPGRTYKYYNGSALFEYGHGLSLTTFSLKCDKGGSPFKFSCSVQNTGSMDGDEVLMVFHSAGDAIRTKANHPVPIKSLVDFERVTVAVGKAVTIDFDIDPDAVKLVNNNGEKVLYPGNRKFIVSTGAGPTQELEFSL